MAKLEIVSERIRKTYNEMNKKSWRKVGAKFGITGGMAFRIAKRGYEPKTAKIRQQLDLPAMLPAPVCPRCGDVHTTKRCTANTNKRKAPWYRCEENYPDDERMDKVLGGWK